MKNSLQGMLNLKLIFFLSIMAVLPAIAETISNTNDISAAKADSTIAAVQKNLDKSIYGFYSMLCQDGFTLNYRLFKPPTVSGLKYPLVITLHGSGPEGYDNTAQMAGVGPTIWGQAEFQATHPHYSVCPQVSPEPHSKDWKNAYAKEYIELRDTLIRMYPDIDTTRIYLTGFSSGGGITLRMLAYYPTSFAAGIAASGQIGGKTEGYAGMSEWPPVYVENNTQIWMFAGGKETADPNQINGMNTIADSISARGGSPRTTYFPNLNHSQVEGMYKLESGLFDWLFAQQRSVVNATITALGATTFCFGDSVTLTASEADFYLWSNGETTQSIKVKISGNFSVKVTNSKGFSATSPVTTINVFPLPEIPVITANSNILSSSSTTGNQWYLDGNLIEGAKSQTYSALKSGNYSIVITDSNGCSSESDIFNFISVDVNDLTVSNYLTIIPNPASDYIEIKVGVQNFEPLQDLKIYNILGEYVKDLTPSASPKSEKGIRVDVSDLPAGIYFLKKGDKFYKFVKM